MHNNGHRSGQPCSTGPPFVTESVLLGSVLASFRLRGGGSGMPYGLELPEKRNEMVVSPLTRPQMVSMDEPSLC